MGNQCNRSSEPQKAWVNDQALNSKDEQFKSEKRMTWNNVAFNFQVYFVPSHYTATSNKIKQQHQWFACNAFFIKYPSAHWHRALSTERAADTTNVLCGCI